ncbi:hypothetical protein BH11CYA1_BH11CYA1_21740 [soil metagenome]
MLLSSRSSSSSRSEYLIIAICAAVAVCACLIQNIIHPSGTTLVFDSGHYMGTIQLLCQAIQANVAGLPLTESEKLNAFLLLDGPLVPLVGAFVFTLLGKIPQALDWRTFIHIEIFFQAIATASLTYLAFNISPGKHAKYLATGTGLAWALYPPAILSTDSFLGELPATALLLLAMCLMTRMIKLTAVANSANASNIFALIIGLLLAVIFMSKPALVLSLVLLATLWITVLFAALFILQTRDHQAIQADKHKIISVLVSFGLGAALALTPWLLFTHSTSGHWRLCAYRVPIYNITRGMSCNSDGWGTVPLDQTMQSYSEDMGALSCMAAIFKEQPLASVNLAIRKPERLWLLPWNDYHHKCLGLGLGIQIFLHQLAIALAAVGLVLLPLSLAKQHSTAKFIALAAPLVILGHITYIPFETCSRYGFTGMPMVFLLCAIAVDFIANNWRHHLKSRLLSIGLCFYIIATILVTRIDLQSLLQGLSLPTAAAVGLECLGKAAVIIGSFILAHKIGSSGQPHKRLLLHYSSKAMAVALCGVVIVYLMAHFLYNREARTWKCNLEAGQSISRKVRYTENSKASWRILLIDCEASGRKNRGSADHDNLLEGSTVSINGKELTEPCFNPSSLIQTWAKLDQMQADFASIFGKTPASLRQWRAFYIPQDYLQDNNDIKLEAGRPLTIYGDSNQLNEQPAFIPAIEYLSAVKLLYEQESPDGRVVTPTFAGKPSVCLPATKELLEGDDLSPALGRQCGTYRMYIVSGNNQFWQRQSLNTSGFAEAF